VIDKVNNLTVFTGVSNVKIYFSDSNSFEVIAIDSFRKNSTSLILGEALISNLSSSELHSVILEALIKIKSKETRFLVLFIVITSIMKTPLSFLDAFGKLKMLGKLFLRIRSFALLFIYPLLLIEKQIITFIKTGNLGQGKENCYCHYDRAELSVAISKLVQDEELDSTTIVGFARAHLNMFIAKDDKSLVEMCRKVSLEDNSFLGVRSEKGC
jgi:hypothetical protein